MYPITFESEKPPSPPVVSSTNKKGDQPVSLLSGKRVAVVEDEGITLLQLSRILRCEGMEVVGTASDGKEAIEMVLATRPDLVLMDIQMPVMDGLEASERILAEYKVCIVILTAFSDEEYMERAREIGTGGYVLKPITADSLIPQLQAAFQKFHQTPQ
jgi:YesN/AraC family two-component response regulator